LIDQIEFDSVIYPIEQRKIVEDGLELTEFYTKVDSLTYKFCAVFTSQFVEDVTAVCGIDSETELKNILNLELKYEMFDLVYGKGSVKQVLDTMESNSIKSDEELRSLADSDGLVDAYARIFKLFGEKSETIVACKK
jgi:hypothetical protein